MVVKRIVTNIATRNVEDAKAFYEELLGPNFVVDQGWIITLASAETEQVQISFASESGSGTRDMTKSW